MTAKRSYVYHYRERGDCMDVWFAKGDGRTSDYFFHTLEFEFLGEGRERGVSEPWRARSSHLCESFLLSPFLAGDRGRIGSGS